MTSNSTGSVAIGRASRILLCIFISVTAAISQNSPPADESALHAEFRLEGERFHKSCVTQFSIANCPYLLLTDHPLHIAVGSIAPQNGFGAGPALITHYDAKNWYYKGDFDAIASTNGSWRAGAYIKIIPVPKKKIIVVRGTGEQPRKSNLRIFDLPLFTAYAQGISLNKIDFFGLGPATTTAGRSYFGMQETIIGTHEIIPMPRTRRLNMAIIGEINGRFVNIRPSPGQPSPSIQALYNNATAPGLVNQPGFVQFGEGVRLEPSLGDYLKLNYLLSFQQFVAPSDSTFSFRRFTVDLGHEIPFYRTVVVTARDTNNPDECGTGTKDLACPPLKSSSRNHYGAINLRFLLTESYTSAGSVVPFYFQPTLGGSDINGSPTLPSYQDYRFRGPNLMLFHAGLEHSVFNTPVGVIFGADAGKVALTRDDIDLQHLRHSYSAGITLRAGGFPMLYLLFATGGHEGNHFIANLNTSLLGGSSRPSLF